MENFKPKRENYFYITKITTTENGEELRERIESMRLGSRKEKDAFAKTLNQKSDKPANVRYE